MCRESPLLLNRLGVFVNVKRESFPTVYICLMKLFTFYQRTFIKDFNKNDVNIISFTNFCPSSLISVKVLFNLV